MVAVLGKNSRLLVVTSTGIVDLTPDYGGFTYDGTTRVLDFAPAQRVAIHRTKDKVDYSLSIDSLRWSSADAAPSLVNGEDVQIFMALGVGSFQSLIWQNGIIAGKGVTTPTDDLIDVALTPDLTGPPKIGLGQTEPTASTNHLTDATGLRIFEVPSSGSNQTVWSDWARSPASEEYIELLVLDSPVSNQAQFTLDGRNANGGGTLGPITVPHNRLNSEGYSRITKPVGWQNLEINYRLGRRSGAGGAQHGEVWLLGAQTKE